MVINTIVFSSVFPALITVPDMCKMFSKHWTDLIGPALVLKLPFPICVTLSLMWVIKSVFLSGLQLPHSNTRRGVWTRRGPESLLTLTLHDPLWHLGSPGWCYNMWWVTINVKVRYNFILFFLILKNEISLGRNLFKKFFLHLMYKFIMLCTI